MKKRPFEFRVFNHATGAYGDVPAAMQENTEFAFILEDGFTIEQFIGKYDSEGKKIFEGDVCKSIVKGVEVIGVMIYDEARAQFGLDAEVDNPILDAEYEEVLHAPTVLGSALLNPELLIKK